jgi:hypothetical protein
VYINGFLVLKCFICFFWIVHYWLPFITQCCIEYTSPWTGFELSTSVVIGTDWTGSCNSNYHVITTTTVRVFNNRFSLKNYILLIWWLQYSNHCSDTCFCNSISVPMLLADRPLLLKTRTLWGVLDTTLCDKFVGDLRKTVKQSHVKQLNNPTLCVRFFNRLTWKTVV